MLQRVVTANGAEIPTIGLGTGRLRGDVAIAAVRAALDHGYRHIDTAAKYGNEVEVGEAIRGHATPRSEIFVTTKAMPTRGRSGRVDLAVEASLERLQLEQVDMILLHWPDQHVPIRDQVEALCEVRQRGLTRHIGVSNFPVRYLEAAVATATEPIVVNQVESHPYFPQRGLAAACARHGIAISAFCPLGRGALMGDPVVHEIAAAHGKSPAQIVLRWHVDQPLRLAVPSSSNPQRIGDNIAIFDFMLTPLERDRIDMLARNDGRVVRGPSGYDWDGVPA